MIDLKKLGDIIIEIEGLLDKHGLNSLEKDLVVKELIAKMATGRQKQRSSDILRDMDFKSIMKGFMKKED